MRLYIPFLMKMLDRVTISLPRRLPILKRRNDLDRAMRRIAALPPESAPDRAQLADLRFSWGNAGFSPGLDLLEHLALHAVTTEGPILECGSGLSTLLIGCLTQKRGIPFVSLEHHGGWTERMGELLAQYHITNVSLHHAPLREYDGFQWYTHTPDVVSPVKFRFILCDGPPRLTRGGRYGLMPVLGKTMAKDCIIVLDDAFRLSERSVMKRWIAEHGLIIHTEGRFGAFAELRFINAT